MPRRKPMTVKYRRKREGKTNYKKRLNSLMAKLPRFVVRFTNKKIITQFIDFKTSGDIVLIGVDSTALKKFGWNYSLKNMPSAYLTGFLLGKKALKANIKEAILDLGFKSPIKGNKIYACLKGILDSGLNVHHSDEIFPSEERISGKHIQDYKKDSKIVESFKTVKGKIENEK